MLRTQPATTNPLRILIVDRDRPAAEAFAGEIDALLPASPELIVVTCGRLAADALRAGTFDILTVCLQSLDDLGATFDDGIAKLAKLGGTALTIALSESQSVSTSLAAMRAGAHDVIQRPVDGAIFASRIGALAQRHGRAWALTPEPANDPDMAAMLQSAGAALRSAAEAPARPPVLPMWQQEQRIIEDAIASFAGNITLAAQALELNPSTIYRKRQAWAEMDNGAKGAA